ncbi:SnoaL-like domain-containing protein [Pseudotamlana carrageenivorans]|uniref:Polyketide cyclase n=1 Tax=Pseudotamlana carrageenivorans TaxID=2069432 RepID=A0A2I7SKM0_9FLAO|nr:SnoaL-like domain-containing protein [Tamlana carrageenivorans]AUS06433.1 polyketide cyclase [Tamlana carrageenivorans]
MNKLIEQVSNLNDLIIQGQGLKAFDLYYDDDVIMQENNQMEYLGKKLNRKRVAAFFQGITAFRSAKPLHVTIGEKITMVEWAFDLTHKDLGLINYNKVVVQEWENGKVIKERIYYGS